MDRSITTWNAFQNPVYTQVELGNPNAHCARFGICDARLLSYREWNSLRLRHYRTAKAIFTYQSCTRQLDIQFPPGGLLPQALQYFFDSNSFLIESPKTLSPTLCKALGISECSIEAGVYPIQKAPDQWICLSLNTTLAISSMPTM
ncbi:MAG: hypothetical protein R2792_16425 [Saprospiraceae bacterium]